MLFQSLSESLRTTVAQSPIGIGRLTACLTYSIQWIIWISSLTPPLIQLLLNVKYRIPKRKPSCSRLIHQNTHSKNIRLGTICSLLVNFWADVLVGADDFGFVYFLDVCNWDYGIKVHDLQYRSRLNWGIFSYSKGGFVEHDIFRFYIPMDETEGVVKRV